MTEHIGAAPYERGSSRTAHRNGHKPRALRTKVGKVFVRASRYSHYSRDSQSMGRHVAEGMDIRYWALGRCLLPMSEKPCRRDACSDPGLYRGRGAFTRAHIDRAPQVVEIPHQARMHRGASSLGL